MYKKVHYILILFVLSQQVHEVYKIYIFSLLLGYLLQFENSALLVSPLLSLIVALMFVKYLQVIRIAFYHSYGEFLNCEFFILHFFVHLISPHS